MCKLLYLVKVRHVRILCGGQSICRVFQHCLKLIFSLWQYCSFIIIFCMFQFLVCDLRNVTAISIDRTNVHNFMNPWNCKVYKSHEKSVFCNIYTSDLFVDIQRQSFYEHQINMHDNKSPYASFLSIITKNIDQTEIKYL